MSGLKKIGMNSAWMLLGYLFRVGSAFITSIFVARFLGPEQFGEMNYVFSVVLLFSMLTGSCFNQFLRREFVKHPENIGEDLGTAILLKLFGAFLGVGLVAAFSVFSGGDAEIRILLTIYSISLVCMASNLSQILLEALLKSKYIAISDFIQLSLFLVGKLLFVYLKFPLWSFVALQSTEVGLKAILQYYWIKKLNLCPSLSFSRKKAMYLFGESWPYFLSGSAVIIHQRIDQVMLRQMMSTVEVGYYAVAMKISVILSFLPVIISRSMFPSLVKAYENKNQIEIRMSVLFGSMFWITTFMALIITLFSDWPMHFLFGEEYADAIPVLKILAWKSVALSASLGVGEWILLNNIQRIAPLRQVAGVLVNISMNYLLIPRMGVTGAAIASMLTYMMLGIVVPMLLPSLRSCIGFQFRGLNLVRCLVQFKRNAFNA